MNKHYLLVLDEADEYSRIVDVVHDRVVPQEVYNPEIHRHNDHTDHVMVVESANTLKVIDHCSKLRRTRNDCVHQGGDDLLCYRDLSLEDAVCIYNPVISEICDLISECLESTVVIVPKEFWKNDKRMFCESVACTPQNCLIGQLFKQ